MEKGGSKGDYLLLAKYSLVPQGWSAAATPEKEATLEKRGEWTKEVTLT